MKFKIGDRVKYKNNTGKIVKESTEIIKDINSYEIVQYYFIQFKEGSQPDWFLESDLELVQTSEQIAVNKFKEELTDKINEIFKNNVMGVSNFIYPNNQYVKIISYDDSIREEILELLK